MFRRPFSFKGRIRRTEFGITYLCYLFAMVVWDSINLRVDMPDYAHVLFFICFCPAIWCLWAQGAKRCHDRGHSGWYQLIPFYNLWMVFASGTFGRNKYGQDPKSRYYYQNQPDRFEQAEQTGGL